MLQYILPSFLATLIGLILIYIFKRANASIWMKSGQLLSYNLIYITILLLPLSYEIIAIPGTTMNWAGKLLAVTFSITVYFIFKKQWQLDSFINFSPDPSALKKVLMVGGVTLVAIGLLVFISSGGQAIDVENLAFQATMPGIDEELWRGILIALIFPLFKNSRFKMGHPAVWFTTMIFAVGHSLFLQDWSFSFQLPAFIVTGGMGYVLGWVILKSKSFFPALILHNLLNLTINVIPMFLLN